MTTQISGIFAESSRTFSIGYWSVVSEVDAASLRLAAGDVRFLPVLHDVAEGEAEVLLGRLQHEVLGVEVDERVEQHVRGVRAQLLRLPQVLLLDATHDQT